MDSFATKPARHATKLSWRIGPSVGDKPLVVTAAGYSTHHYPARVPVRRNVVPYRMACMVAHYRKVRLPHAA